MEQRANLMRTGRMSTGTVPALTVAHCIALLAGDTGGQSADNPDFTVTRLYNPLCVSRRIDTWQIVYLSYKEPCPTLSIHKMYIHVPSVLSAVCIAQN